MLRPLCDIHMKLAETDFEDQALGISRAVCVETK